MWNLTFLRARKENMSCLVCCEVFLFGLVCVFAGGVWRLTEGGNGLCLSLFPWSAYICVPATHNKHSSDFRDRSLFFKPQESSLRQPPPERGLYTGIHLFQWSREWELVLFYSGCWGSIFNPKRSVFLPALGVFVANVCGSRPQYWSQPI